jgi:hypothetical protein
MFLVATGNANAPYLSPSPYMPFYAFMILVNETDHSALYNL